MIEKQQKLKEKLEENIKGKLQDLIIDLKKEYSGYFTETEILNIFKNEIGYFIQRGLKWKKQNLKEKWKKEGF